MQNAPVGVAVIGCGSTAHRRHLPVWRDLAGAHLVAVASRDADRRHDAAKRYGADRAVADWRELLIDPTVVAVDVCVPHPQHAEIAIAMARAGKHVLCEKPLAPNLAEAEAMVSAARAAGVVLLPFLNMRLMGAAATAISLVRSGAIGLPRLIRGVMAHGGPDRADTRRRWFLEAASGGGAILDLGPHLFDLVAQLVASPVQRVRASLLHVPGLEVERDGLVEVEYTDGTVAWLTLSWSMASGRETGITVHGETGSLRLNLLQAPDPSPDAAAAPLILSAQHAGQAQIDYPAPAAAEEPCSLFLRAITGQPVPLTAQAGLEAARYVDAAYRSHRQGGVWVPYLVNAGPAGP